MRHTFFVFGERSSGKPRRITTVWLTTYLSRSVIICSGARLRSVDARQLTTDPALAIWLFAVLTQCQVFLALIAVVLPTLKRTVLDLVTNYGAPDESPSNSRPGRSFAMRSLSSRPKADEPDRRSLWKSPPQNPGTVGRGGKQDTPSDDDSQKGIMRQDEYEVTVSYSTEIPSVISGPSHRQFGSH